MMRSLGGVRKSIHQSWLAKGLGFGLLCWDFKGVQEEIPKESSPQLHPCHRLFDQEGHQDSPSASL